MIVLLFYYIALPMLSFWLVLKLLRRYGKDPVPARLREAVAADPIEKKSFRVVRATGAPDAVDTTFLKLGDFEGQDLAVDAAFQARAAALPTECVLILDPKGDILRQI